MLFFPNHDVKGKKEKHQTPTKTVPSNFEFLPTVKILVNIISYLQHSFTVNECKLKHILRLGLVHWKQHLPSNILSVIICSQTHKCTYIYIFQTLSTYNRSIIQTVYQWNAHNPNEWTNKHNKYCTKLPTQSNNIFNSHAWIRINLI